MVSLLKDGIIMKSKSPWRAQLVVVKGKKKWRMCVDYSNTINRYTEEDAFPFPRIEELVNQLVLHKYFSKYGLKSAYHQIPIHEQDMKFTAFEANGELYQFKRIPFGLKNAVSAFQIAMTELIEKEGLKKVFPYLDDVTVAGHTMEELEENYRKFERACKESGITLNKSKTVRKAQDLSIGVPYKRPYDWARSNKIATT